MSEMDSATILWRKVQTISNISLLAPRCVYQSLQSVGERSSDEIAKEWDDICEQRLLIANDFESLNELHQSVSWNDRILARIEKKIKPFCRQMIRKSKSYEELNEAYRRFPYTLKIKLSEECTAKEKQLLHKDLKQSQDYFVAIDTIKSLCNRRADTIDDWHMLLRLIDNRDKAKHFCTNSSNARYCGIENYTAVLRKFLSFSRGIDQLRDVVIASRGNDEIHAEAIAALNLACKTLLKSTRSISTLQDIETNTTDREIAAAASTKKKKVLGQRLRTIKTYGGAKRLLCSYNWTLGAREQILNKMLEFASNSRNQLYDLLIEIRDDHITKIRGIVINRLYVLVQ